MISLAGRDILHAWGKFVLTGLGLGLLIDVTLTMAGVYRGMVDDAMVLLDNSGADLWVVQKNTLGPYAESSSLYDDVYRSIRSMPGVTRASNVTYLTTQVASGDREARVMVVGVVPAGPGEPGQPGYLIAGRHITRGHYEAVADKATGFRLMKGSIRRNLYTVVGLTRRTVSSGGDPMVFIPLKDAQEAQFLKDNDAIVQQRRRTASNPAFDRPGVPGLTDAVTASQSANPLSMPCWYKSTRSMIRMKSPRRFAGGNAFKCTPVRRWKIS
jgi:putative ABC transport system permease protein